jgi:hypothetical protein
VSFVRRLAFFGNLPEKRWERVEVVSWEKSGHHGKPVRIRREPVAVTGYETRTHATGRKAGKARKIG